MFLNVGYSILRYRALLLVVTLSSRCAMVCSIHRRRDPAQRAGAADDAAEQHDAVRGHGLHRRPVREAQVGRWAAALSLLVLVLSVGRSLQKAQHD